jgi:hypothetical protein
MCAEKTCAIVSKSKMLLLAQPRNGSEIRALIVAAHELGWEVIEAPSGWRLEEELTSSGKVGVPYGSQTFCEVISQQMNWQLKFNPLDWLAKIDRQYLGRKVEFMTLAQAMQLSEPKFVKPADDKVFPAKVYYPGIDSLTPHEIIPRDTPVLVSDPVQFVSEYRCFVKDKQVVTCSCYIMDGEINEPRNWFKRSEIVAAHLTKLLACDIIQSAPAVVDLGYLNTGELVIIESNQAWASGIYGCDLAGVLDTLSVACEKA